MVFHMVPVATLALAMLMSMTAMAGNDARSNTHDGKVVSVIRNELVMTGEKGEEHTHTLATDAQVTLDGKVCKASDLKSGTRIRVTTQGLGKDMVSRIEAIEKDLDFASKSQDGTLVSISGNKLVMTCEQDKQHSRTLAANARVTLDGEACKASDLKSGTRIRVTNEGDDKSPLSRIEAIDKNRNFASL